MRLRINIVFSIMAHAALMTMAFALVGRGWPLSVPADHLTVSLVSGLSEIKPLDAKDQKKQAPLSLVSASRNEAVNGSQEYGDAFKGKTSQEAGTDEGHLLSTSGKNATEEQSPKESGRAGIGPPGESAFPPPAAGHQALSAGKASVDLGHDQVKTQKGANTEDSNAIRKAIEKALIYPLFARKRGLEGTALTEFTVNTKGYPEDIRVIGSSGHSILDTSAKESLIKAAPFTVGKGRYEIPIRFRLKNN